MMSGKVRALSVWLVALGLLSWAGVAVAQEEASAEGASEEKAESPSARRAREEAEAKEKAEREKAQQEAQAGEEAKAEGEGASAGEEAAPGDAPDVADVSGSDEERLDVFWGGQRNVSVVQKRLFTKDKRSEISLFGGVIPNDPFRTYAPIGARYNYYFVESVSVEVAGSWMGLEVDSGLKKLLRDKNSAMVDLLDNQIWRANVAVSWSPFYGKLSMFDSQLSHFDISLFGGGGVLQTTSPSEDRTTEESRLEPEALLGMGFRFFLTQSLTMRLDFRQFIFQKVGGGTSTPSEVTLGISFFLGG